MTPLRPLLQLSLLILGFCSAETNGSAGLSSTEDPGILRCQSCPGKVPGQGKLNCTHNIATGSFNQFCSSRISELSVKYYLQEDSFCEGFVASEPKINVTFLWTQLTASPPLPVSVTVMFMSSPRLGDSKTITIDPGGIHFKGNKTFVTFDCFAGLVTRMRYSVTVRPVPDRLCSSVAERIYVPDVGVGSTATTWIPEVLAESGTSPGQLHIAVQSWPQSFQYGGYRVQLYQCDNDNCDTNIVKTNNITMNIEMTRWLNTSFEGLSAGRYKVRVFIIPPPNTNKKYRSGATDIVDIHALDEPELFPAVKGLWGGFEAGVIVLVLCVAILLAFIVRYIISPKRRKSGTVTKDDAKAIEALYPGPEDERANHINGDLIQARNKQEWKIRQMKQVLLLFSDDFPEHEEVVHNFASYLDHRCGCDVSLELWQPCTEPNQINWIIGEIRKAHSIIVIASEGAYKKHEARMQNVRLRDTSNRPRRDIFAQVIQLIKTEYIFSDSSKPVGEFFMVWFPYSSKDHLLEDLRSQVTCFELMRYIDELILAIHGLEHHANGLRNSIPTITGETYADCEEGRLLCNSIDAAKRFTAKNPDWFDQRFSRRTRTDSGLGMHIPSNGLSLPQNIENYETTFAPHDDHLSCSCSSSDSMDDIERQMADNNALFNASINNNVVW